MRPEPHHEGEVMIGLLLAWMGFEFGPFAKPAPPVEVKPVKVKTVPVWRTIYEAPMDQKHEVAMRPMRVIEKELK